MRSWQFEMSWTKIAQASLRPHHYIGALKNAMERYFDGESERHLPRTYLDDYSRPLRGFDEVDKFLANAEFFRSGIGRDMPLVATAPSPYLHRHAGSSALEDVGLESRMVYGSGRDTLPRKHSRQPLLGTSLPYYNQSPQKVPETRLPESALSKVRQSPSTQSILYADETEKDERSPKVSYPPSVYYNYKYQYDRPKAPTPQSVDLDRPQSNLDTAQHFSRAEKRRKSSAFKSLRSFLKKHLKMNSHALPNHTRSDYLDGSKKMSSASLYEAAKPATSQQLSASTHNINGLNSARLRTDNGFPPLARAHSFSASKARANHHRESADWNPKAENKIVTSDMPSSKARSIATYPSTTYSETANRHIDTRMDTIKSQAPSSQLVQKINAGATLPRTSHTMRPSIAPAPIKEPKRKPVQYDAPCLYGILNHGNSCYMNAILQCLASVNRVAILFVCKKFIIPSLVTTGDLSATVDNSITSVLSQTLQSMWMNANPDGQCLRLLRLIANANPHFQLSCQQDAQESLIWLLDRIHEEIKGENLSKKANSFATLHKSEEELAIDALQRVSGSNRSAIMDLFQAQFRSSMECSACGFFNLTFDPYITVALSVPQPKSSKACTALFVPYFNGRQLVRYRISVPGPPTTTCITHIKDKIMTSIGGSGDNAIACQFSANGQCHFLADDLQLGNESPFDNIDNFYLLEIPRLTVDHENQDLVVAIITHVVGFVPSGGRRGQPYTVVVSKRWNYDRILQQLIDKAKPFMCPNDYFPLQSDFRLLIQHSSEGVIYMDPALSMPLFNYHINRSGSSRRALLKIIIEWTSSAAYEFLRQDSEPIHEDYSFLTDNQSPESSVTLLNLLQDYTKTEVVEDWKCPKCFKASSGKKELKFHSLPPVLVFHLKRFELLNDGATKKVESLLQIPLESLDMSPYVCNPESRHNTLSRSHKYNATPYKNGLNECGDQERCLYDLVGVVHHFGERTNSGHYTASTRNPIDGRWRTFDDMKVTFTNTSDIRSSTNAYLLFYERRESHSSRNSASSWFPHSVPESVLNLYNKPSPDERRANSSMNGVGIGDSTGVTVHGSSTFYTRGPSAGQVESYRTPTKSGSLQANAESSPARSRSLHNLQPNMNKGSYGTLRNYPS
ncbi:ubiquitin carboxyl-terminal hydrolase domain-containing protein [Ditylenchus destructor]|uniref:ubiquitinyl hydrolase 1 n=1 Tax=Ditylenchus destructor TaxID=166010 RepID=A0AAD4NCX0_9BILA|nr:ubiquitin carboxyl-terminal hydrolase domain-containing protein [Ditylenchus destructor]